MALLLADTAAAAARSSVAISGDGVALNLDVATTTAAYDYGAFDIVLSPGQSVTETFTYTVTVRDDGAPAVRGDGDVCTPNFISDCGPAPTGYEQAYASIFIGRDRRDVTDGNYAIDDNALFLPFQSVTGSAHTSTGTFDYVATNTSSFAMQFTGVDVMIYALADVGSAAPVPEPTPSLAWAAALPALALLGRRRARASRAG